LTCVPAMPGLHVRTVLVCIRPEYVALHPENIGDSPNVLEGRVDSAMFLGEYIDCTVDVDGRLLHVRAHPSMSLSPGQHVKLHLPVEQCVALSAEVVAGGAPEERV